MRLRVADIGDGSADHDLERADLDRSLKGPKTRSGAISVDVCSRDGGFRVKGMACPARAVEPACCPRAEFLVSEAPWRF
jgi:hypothetical protein